MLIAHGVKRILCRLRHQVFINRIVLRRNKRMVTLSLSHYYGMLWGALSMLRGIADLVTSVAFRIINSYFPEKIPPIQDLLLLDSATTLALKIRQKKVTSERVVKAYIKRIQEVNGILNAMVDERFKDALEEAKAVDQFLAETQKTEEELALEKPFLGVPFTNKESIAVQGMKITLGLVSRKDCVCEKDAIVVQLMREAGAISLGVTNVSECCMYWECFNRVYGTTRNPYDTRRTTGGSSGGEGALLSSGASAMGIGSDVGGSIRIPSHFTGVFGFKPSGGLVSNEGQLPVAVGDINNMLVTGPMSRFAVDLPLIYRVILSPQNLSRVQLDKQVKMSELRFFYTDCETLPLTSPVDPEIRDGLNRLLAHLTSAYDIKPMKVRVNGMKRALEMWTMKMQGEGPSFCKEISSMQPKEVNPFVEGVKSLVGYSDHTYPAILLGILEKLLPHTQEFYDSIKQQADAFQKEFQDLLGDDGVFLFPSWPTAAPFHNQGLFQAGNFAYTAMFNAIKLPVAQCPLQLNRDGLPIGVQVVGSMYNDHLPLAVAQEIEKAFGGWIAPCSIAV